MKNLLANLFSKNIILAIFASATLVACGQNSTHAVTSPFDQTNQVNRCVDNDQICANSVDPTIEGNWDSHCIVGQNFSSSAQYSINANGTIQVTSNVYFGSTTCDPKFQYSIIQANYTYSAGGGQITTTMGTSYEMTAISVDAVNADNQSQACGYTDWVANQARSCPTDAESQKPNPQTYSVNAGVLSLTSCSPVGSTNCTTDLFYKN